MSTDCGDGDDRKATAATSTKPSSRYILLLENSVTAPLGKKNSIRPIPRILSATVYQKPWIKPMPRGDKSTARDGDGSVTRDWSSSSYLDFIRKCVRRKELEYRINIGAKNEDIVTEINSRWSEKVVFLQRIGSDIKRTKEMLDINASKAILSDIQETINASTKKAMSHVMNRKFALGEIKESHTHEKKIELPKIELKVEEKPLCDDLTARECLFSSDRLTYKLTEIGHKTCTAGWFVSEGESFLLAYADGSCSFYDIVNTEKAEYKLPAGMTRNLWRDCWILSAPGPDGCSGKYVVAASAGNSLVSGYCSWDFYSKEVLSHTIWEDTRTALAPSPDNPWGGPARGQKGVIIGASAGTSCGKEAKKGTSWSKSSPFVSTRWWYQACGPVIIATGSCQKYVKLYDVRDGKHPLKWTLEKPVLSMKCSSPLQWRNKERLVITEEDAEQGENIISLWDVGSLNQKSLLTISCAGRKLTALYVNNADAEMGGGVRQRASSSEGNDGIFCTTDGINVLDFRIPSGIGLKIPRKGRKVQSIFCCGDFIYLGCKTLGRSTVKRSLIEQFSLRTQKLLSVYILPEESNENDKGITQVWGNSEIVMGVCGSGLSIFDQLKDDGILENAFHKGKSVIGDYGKALKVKEVIGPNDMNSYPSFDYLGSRVLLISRDRPAQWRYL